MLLYRYRNIKNAVSELDNGTLYFAEPKELNDPLEGYLKIFWQGDKFAWQGLLKKYICSLFYHLQTYLLTAAHYPNKESLSKDFQSKNILLDTNKFKNSPMSQIFAEIGEKFLSEDRICEVIEFYGDDKIKCYGREMEFIFRTVIDVAFTICVDKCKNLGLIRDDFDEKFFDVEYEISFDELKNIDNSTRKHKIDELENLNRDMLESCLLGLKFRGNSTNDLQFLFKQHMLWLRFIFPRIFVENLKEILYPNGYVVCFSKNPTNSSMWGNYADNHGGICFVYETEHVNGHEFLTFSAESLEVKPIKYCDEVIERNFFDMLQYLNFLDAKDWLTGLDGQKSKKLTAPKDFACYDDDYQEKFYRKMTDWNYEQEYRIFLPDKFYRYEDKFSRNLKYNLSALIGIIFGIRTTIDDKLEILQKLARLGKSFSDFKFFQAEYDDDTQLLSIREKTLLTNFS